jgi:hypothetical protein
MSVAAHESPLGPRGDAETPWTPARMFLLVAAVWHIPLGIIGLFYNHDFPIGAGAARTAGSAQIAGVFTTNGWHNLAALVLGLVALVFTLYPARARTVALAIGVIHVGITLALLIWEPSTFWIASNTADQFIHASSAVGGIACGLATKEVGVPRAAQPPVAA